MTDLERFFHHLVRTLSVADPARLRDAIPLGEIYGSIVPYRGHRRALGLDASEDYEAVLMRLAAGEDGYAGLSPEESRQRLERELQSPHPDLAVLRQVGDAVLSLAPSRVAEALAAARDGEPLVTPQAEPTMAPTLSIYEPPPDAPADMLDALLPAPDPIAEPLPTDDAPAPVATEGMYCLACGEGLPSHRRIKFCPYCGEGLVPAHCAGCGAAMEAGWRFCAVCGHQAGGRPASGGRA